MSIRLKLTGADGYTVRDLENVIGHVIVAVQKHGDKSLTIERDVAVNADTFEDNQIVEDFVKKVQAELDKVLPEPKPIAEPKIWVPA